MALWDDFIMYMIDWFKEVGWGMGFAIGFVIFEKLMEKLFKVDIFFMLVRKKRKPKAKPDPLMPVPEVKSDEAKV